MIDHSNPPWKHLKGGAKEFVATPSGQLLWEQDREFRRACIFPANFDFKLITDQMAALIKYTSVSRWWETALARSGPVVSQRPIGIGDGRYVEIQEHRELRDEFNRGHNLTQSGYLCAVIRQRVEELDSDGRFALTLENDSKWQEIISHYQMGERAVWTVSDTLTGKDLGKEVVPPYPKDVTLDQIKQRLDQACFPNDLKTALYTLWRIKGLPRDGLPLPARSGLVNTFVLNLYGGLEFLPILPNRPHLNRTQVIHQVMAPAGWVNADFWVDAGRICREHADWVATIPYIEIPLCDFRHLDHGPIDEPELETDIGEHLAGLLSVNDVFERQFARIANDKKSSSTNIEKRQEKKRIRSRIYRRKKIEK